MQPLSQFLARVDPPQTPVLIVRRAALMANLAAMQAACSAAGVRLRAHGKMHKCSRLGLAQVSGGAVGLCCQTVGEAQAYARAGIGDLLVTAPPAPWGWPRLAALAAGGTHIAAVVDSMGQIERAAAAAVAAGTRIGVVVDVDLGLHRTGVMPADTAMLVARIVREPGLRYDGIQAYCGNLQHIVDRSERAAANAAATTRLRALVADLQANGLAPPQVTGGGTGTYAFDLEGGVFTELQAGSYALMDVEYGDCAAPDGGGDDGGEWAFAPALFLATTVISARHKSHATCDAGLKSLSSDGPAARVVGGAPAGSRWRPMGDEHGAIIHPDFLAGMKAGAAAIDAMDADPAIGWPGDAPGEAALVFLQPGHVDPTVALHDAMFVADEDGRLERWPIDAGRVTA